MSAVQVKTEELRSAEAPADQSAPRASGLAQLLAARRGLLLWALFALCLAPRLILALKLEGVCHDANYYIAIADALERGDTRPLLQSLNVNIYPVILVGLHRLGLDWLQAGKLWGAFMASLAVLPMYGWIRRMFDERVAAAACFLYAIHPELIELSAEPIREPTFWLLFAGSLYLLSRAAGEARLLWFALGGITTALAIHTRTEGWFLLAAALIWPAARWFAPEPRRLRLAFGTLLCLAMTPAFITSANATLLRDHPQWEWGRADLLRKSWNWLAAQWTTGGPTTGKPPASTTPDGTSSTVPAPLPRASANPAGKARGGQLTSQRSASTPGGNARPAAAAAGPQSKETAVASAPPAAPAGDDLRAWAVVLRCLKSFGVLNVILLPIGVWVARRGLRRSGDIVLLAIALMVAAGVWVFVSIAGSMNSRYILTAFLVLVPYAGIGLIALAAAVRARMEQAFGEARHSRMATIGLACAIAGICFGDAFLSKHSRREAQVALGRVLRERFGQFQSIVADLTSVNVCYPFRRETFPATNICREEPLEDLILNRDPQLVVIADEGMHPSYRARLLRAGKRHGLAPVDRESLPAAAAGLLIMVPEIRAIAAAQAPRSPL